MDGPSFESLTTSLVADASENGQDEIGLELNAVWATFNASLKVSRWGDDYPADQGQHPLRFYAGVGWMNAIQLQYGNSICGTQSMRLRSELPIGVLWGRSAFYNDVSSDVNSGRNWDGGNWSGEHAWFDRVVISAYGETYFPGKQYGIGIGFHLWNGR